MGPGEVILINIEIKKNNGKKIKKIKNENEISKNRFILKM